MHRQTNSTRTHARGVTIIELLIVMMILLMVTAAAIPLMAPAVQNRRMRETSRLVSSYFFAARARAIETGRPVGVMIERFNGQNFAMSLAQVEIPQPFGGDTQLSRMALTTDGKIKFMGFIGDITKIPLTPNQSDGSATNLVRNGDLVRFDYKGPLYLISTDPNAANLPGLYGKVITTAPDTGNPWYLFRADSAPINLPTTYGTGNGAPVSFQIIRQPVRSSAAPLQLPEGVVIDLLVSDLGQSGSVGSILSNINTGVTPPKYGDVLFNPVITFRPSGSVDYVTKPMAGPAPPPPTPPPTIAQGQSRPNGPIFLLLGRRELMPDVSKSQYDENLYDPATTNPKNESLQNFWITIGPQTGSVSVSENAANNGGPLTDPTAARKFALDRQSIGGQ